MIDLKKGAVAPYDGVLANETAFRFYVNQADLYMMCTQSLESCDNEYHAEKGSIISTKTLLAFLAGGLVIYTIRR